MRDGRLAAAVLGAACTLPQAAVLDDLRDTSAWRAAGSDQVSARLRRDADGSLCLDYDFNGVSGYAVMRRALPVEWPAHFDLVVRLKGRGRGERPAGEVRRCERGQRLVGEPAERRAAGRAHAICGSAAATSSSRGGRSPTARCAARRIWSS